jgi:hypothetical protein
MMVIAGGGVVRMPVAQSICLLVFMVFLTLPARAASEESRPAAESNTQRAACDAKCREDYQSNAGALQACLRACGAIGPASAGAIAVSPDGTLPQSEQSTVKSSKSNSSERAGTVKGSKSNTSELEVAGPGVAAPASADAANLNFSKSSIDRSAEEESGTPAEGDAPSTADED